MAGWDSEPGLPARQVHALPCRPHCPQRPLDLTLTTALRRDIHSLCRWETEALSERTHSSFPFPVGSLVPSLESPLFCRDPGGLGSQRLQGAWAGRRPRVLSALKRESGSRIRAAAGHGGSSAPCCSHSFLPLAQLTRTPSGLSPLGPSPWDRPLAQSPAPPVGRGPLEPGVRPGDALRQVEAPPPVGPAGNTGSA